MKAQMGSRAGSQSLLVLGEGRHCGVRAGGLCSGLVGRSGSALGVTEVTGRPLSSGRCLWAGEVDGATPHPSLRLWAVEFCLSFV